MKLHIETTGSGPRRIAFVRGLANDATVWALDAIVSHWDRKMGLSVLQDVATHPYRVTRPAAPSTVVLSGDALYVVPDPLPETRKSSGWTIVREDSLGHAMFLENPDLVWELIEPAL
ncbi:hypothetical protein [Microbacterium oleivorans]|uniref:Alpha/beta hydrolase n=1 Tax=Microbacterium oleivorans TaxID=273677 RepID=A0A7D5IZH0_9MICO|nr:hypothetical protein [Microbacterium oleivorans]QLD11955.1 hypothetical protein HW566_09360 [Microbacterium oleivorans]